MNKEYLETFDLYTLEQIKFIFGLHSDGSTSCNGYRSLCDLIEKVKNLDIDEWVDEKINR